VAVVRVLVLVQLRSSGKMRDPGGAPKKPLDRDPIYRKYAFDADIIELCVRWYVTYRLSYRDLVERGGSELVKAVF